MNGTVVESRGKVLPRGPAKVTWMIVLLPLALSLLALDALCYRASLPIDMIFENGSARITVGNETLSLQHVAFPTGLVFGVHDPVIHEYQIDGTDTTNNYMLDANYLHQFSSSPYYTIQSWMRDLEGTSQWRDLNVWASGKLVGRADLPAENVRTSLPAATSLHITVALQRPETPMDLDLYTSGGGILHLVIDRNDRYFEVTRSLAGQKDQTLGRTFFPTDPIPFTAMVLDFLVRTALWAIVILVVVSIIEIGIDAASLGQLFARRWEERRAEHSFGGILPMHRRRMLFQMPQRLASAEDRLSRGWQRLTSAIHPLGLLTLVASFAFVLWIALVQYHAQAHIYDASAYLFGAKIFASGRLWVPVPPAADRFPGLYMVQFDGRWFPQNDPGTSFTLALGVWLGMPWIVEPLLGTLALLGIGLIAARLYDRRIATLSIFLGALSPFYSYLAASYLSHAIALFYLVWGFWFLLRFAQGSGNWNLLAATLLFGLAALTRDTALLFVAVVVPGVFILSRQQVRDNWRRWLVPLLGSAVIVFFFILLSRSINATLTGSPVVTPRQLYFPGDHWGFGQNIGFFGEHTLAAGIVNLDQLLTSLAIDLFGWPFYLTLAFLAIPFLVWRTRPADWLLAVGAVVMIGAYVGYFFNGIYLGPRYLFESLPFLLILTARGIFTLGGAARDVRRMVRAWIGIQPNVTSGLLSSASLATVGLIIALVACSVLYYIPRQIVVHQDFTDFPAGVHIDTEVFNHPPVHHAIVVTDNYALYQYTLFSLNDPLLHGDVLYAVASDPSQCRELRAAFPGRKVYRIDIGTNWSVSFVPISG
jgi:hypothetical protein